jgi:CDP-diacylglycerol---glycerol-3-phosphate 3-phosphatidyltransferase
VLSDLLHARLLDALSLEAPAARWGPVLVTACLVAAFLAFAVRSAVMGRPRTARVEKAGGSVLLSKYVMEYGLWVFGPVARTAIRLEISPDVFTWASLVLQLAAAFLVAAGWFGVGACVLVAGAMCDALDGAVARGRGIASDAGEVLDAVIDRWAEMALFFGYAWYYRTIWWGFILAVGACAGAVMVSYTRAKAEAYGIDAAMGLMQRHERAAWLAVATLGASMWEAWRPTPAGELVFHTPVLVTLGIIAGLANWTGWLRAQYARQELRKR